MRSRTLFAWFPIVFLFVISVYWNTSSRATLDSLEAEPIDSVATSGGSQLTTSQQSSKPTTAPLTQAPRLATDPPLTNPPKALLPTDLTKSVVADAVRVGACREKVLLPLLAHVLRDIPDVQSLLKQHQNDARQAISNLMLRPEVWQYSTIKAVFDAIRQETTDGLFRNTCWESFWQEFGDRTAGIIRGRLGRFGGAGASGVLYVAPGFHSLVHTSTKGHSWRNGLFPQPQLTHLTAKLCTNFSIFFITYHDQDVYYFTRHNAGERLEMLKLLQDYPNVFFMHYSPSMVMPHGVGASALGEKDPFFDAQGNSVLTGRPRKVGTLYPHMLPVPHTPSIDLYDDKIAAIDPTTRSKIDDFSQRRAMVVWRGATTGQAHSTHPFHDNPGTYHETDRNRMVAALQGKPWADVAFSGYCQGVAGHHIPRFAPGLTFLDMLQYQVHVDVDGNSNSWEGLRWRLRVGMAVVKVASTHGFTQWYYRDLINGKHLIQTSVANIATAAKQLLDNPTLGAELAKNAKAFADERLTWPAFERWMTYIVRDAWRVGLDDTTTWCIEPCLM